MLHSDDPKVWKLLLKGSFGLEKESLRVDANGNLAHTLDPFPGEKHIVRDFCENQTEINTPVVDNAKQAVEELKKYNRKIYRTLNSLKEPEFLWPFSNPPYIKNEADIPVAQYFEEEAVKTEYRYYLSDRYGRYKMTFSGIHFNYSFSEELLQTDFALSPEVSFATYKNNFYVALAEKCAVYSWLIVAITAASPLMDASYVQKAGRGNDLFNGMATTRCSELGYWNYFTPIFDYSSVEKYADSIQSYVDLGLLKYPSELYYPIRLKPPGAYDLDILRREGVDHIELRMIDLNPLCENGIDERDVFFAQLLLVWLASLPRYSLTARDQVQAVQNCKNAARFDLKTVKIVAPNGEVCSVATAGLRVLERMESFFKGYSDEVTAVLHFQKQKFLEPETRYAWRVQKEFSGGFVRKGLALAKKRQTEGAGNV